MLPWIITWSARSSINIRHQSCENATTCNCPHTLLLFTPDIGPKYLFPLWLHCLLLNLQQCSEMSPEILSRAQAQPSLQCHRGCGKAAWSQVPTSQALWTLATGLTFPRLCPRTACVTSTNTVSKQKQKKKWSFHMKNRLTFMSSLNSSRTQT